jgi:hypothetical protein
MNLIWVPNQQYALYFLSLCEKNAHLGRFYIFVQDEGVIPEFKLMAEGIGVNFVDRKFATSNQFDNFYMFSYGILSYQESVRVSVKYQKLWLFGDALNNSLVLHSSARSWEIEGFVYFGYELVDEAFSTFDVRSIRNKEVIKFNGIAKYVKELQDRRNVPDYRNQIDSSAVLVLDRYWGDGSYKIENWEMYERYLSYILCNVEEPKRIIYKGVESDFLGFAESQRLKIFQEITDSDFFDWSQIVSSDSNFRYLTSPEALLLGMRIAPGVFFSFDGSTAMVAELSQFNVKVIWPDEIKLTGIFSEPWIENLIQQKSQMYREVAGQFKIENGLSEIKVITLGTEIREFISRFILEHFVQERDALTQERDALTQERDALTQERDALISSTIWRKTRFLRVLISNYRKVKNS